MPMLPMPGRSPRRYGRVGLVMAAMVVLLLGMYLVIPYQFAGTCLWSAQEQWGRSTLTVRVYPGEPSEQGPPGGVPLLIFWRTGYAPICQKRTISVQSERSDLHFHLEGKILRITGGDPGARMWAMSVFLDAR
jgi:hypothetical protein